MMRYLIFILFVLGVLAGCSLNRSTWESGDEPEGETDLTAFLTTVDPNKVGNVNLNGNEADHGEAPDFTQNLANTIRPAHSKNKKVVNQLDEDSIVEPVDEQPSGKKFVRQKQPSTDLVGSELPQTTTNKDEGEGEGEYAEVIADFNPYVDFLVIRDLSGSNLGVFKERDPQEIRDFFSPLDGLLSWQAMFLSADEFQEGSRLLNLVLNGEVIQNRNVITPDTQNYEDIFVETMTHKTRCRGCGQRKERPLGALNAFLHSDLADTHLRDGADLAVIIITDNDENRYNRKGQMTTSEHIMAVMRSRYENKVIRGYSLTVLDDECRKSVRSRTAFVKEGRYAPVITEFSDRTQGGSFSLCSPSFGEVAEEIVWDQTNN